MLVALENESADVILTYSCVAMRGLRIRTPIMKWRNQQKESMRKQARRQSSVTGGRGGRKIFRGAQINFTLIFGREDQKSLYPGRLPFWVQVSLGGGTFIAWWKLMVRISLLAHKIRGHDQKRRSLARNLRLSWRLLVFFVLERILLTLGEAQARNVLPWHRACYFLSGHNPRLGGTLLARGGRPRNYHHVAPGL